MFECCRLQLPINTPISHSTSLFNITPHLSTLKMGVCAGFWVSTFPRVADPDAPSFAVRQRYGLAPDGKGGASAVEIPCRTAGSPIGYRNADLVSSTRPRPGRRFRGTATPASMRRLRAHETFPFRDAAEGTLRLSARLQVPVSIEGNLGQDGVRSSSSFSCPHRPVEPPAPRPVVTTSRRNQGDNHESHEDLS